MNAMTPESPVAQTKSAPVTAAWVCLVIAWVCFIVPIPGVGLFIGWPLNLVAFILAIVIMARGWTVKGLIPLISSLIVSPIIYFIGWLVFGAAAAGLSSGSYADYKDRVEQATANANAIVSAPEMIITADELYRAYAANAISADEQYEGKHVEITGTVEAVRADFSQMPIVMLKAGEMGESVSASGLSNADADTLVQGASVTLNCTVDGEDMGIPQLDDCALK